MTQKEIKLECENLYARIKESKDRLEELREICKHPETFEGLYSYRVGATMPSTICSDCGKRMVKPIYL